MKTVILALLVLLAVNQSEGLRCRCGGKKICSSPIETCTPLADACGSILITAGSMPSFSRGCVSSRDCMRMNYPGISSCHSCGFDLCN